MPFADHKKATIWNREYQRRRSRLARAEHKDVEGTIIKTVRENPGKFSTADLYDHFQGSVAFTELVKIVNALVNEEGYGGLLERKRDPIRRREFLLYPREPVAVALPQPTSAESQPTAS